MNRPTFLRTLSVIAAVLTAVGMLMNIIIVLNPHIAAILMGYGSIKDLMETNFDKKTEMLLLIQAAIPTIMLILCGIGCFADKISKKRSLLMLISTFCGYILMTATVSFVYTIAIRSAASINIETVQLLSSITSVRGLLSYLYVFSFVIIMCANSVEYYIIIHIPETVIDIASGIFDSVFEEIAFIFGRPWIITVAVYLDLPSLEKITHTAEKQRKCHRIDENTEINAYSYDIAQHSHEYQCNASDDNMLELLVLSLSSWRNK